MRVTQPEDLGLPEDLRARFVARRLLGRGGFGRVLLAEDRSLLREVALKLLDPDPGEATGGVDRFEREARLTARIEHPGVVRVFDHGRTEDGTRYLVYEFLPGADLATILDRSRKLPPAEVISLVGEVAEALAAAHEKGIVHRDVKPQNVLRDPAGRHVLVDFGIARDPSATTRATAEGMLLGTPGYMPPEVLVGGKPPGPPADTYALAAMAAELVTGRPPYGTADPREILSAVLGGSRLPDPETRRRLPEGWLAWLAPALAERPEDRPIDLRGWAASAPGPSPSRSEVTVALSPGTGPSAPTLAIAPRRPTTGRAADPTAPGPPPHGRRAPLLVGLAAAAFALAWASRTPAPDPSAKGAGVQAGTSLPGPTREPDPVEPPAHPAWSEFRIRLAELSRNHPETGGEFVLPAPGPERGEHLDLVAAEVIDPALGLAVDDAWAALLRFLTEVGPGGIGSSHRQPIAFFLMRLLPHLLADIREIGGKGLRTVNTLAGAADAFSERARMEALLRSRAEDLGRLGSSAFLLGCRGALGCVLEPEPWRALDRELEAALGSGPADEDLAIVVEGLLLLRRGPSGRSLRSCPERAADAAGATRLALERDLPDDPELPADLARMLVWNQIHGMIDCPGDWSPDADGSHARLLRLLELTVTGIPREDPLVAWTNLVRVRGEDRDPIGRALVDRTTRLVESIQGLKFLATQGGPPLSRTSPRRHAARGPEFEAALRAALAEPAPEGGRPPEKDAALLTGLADWIESRRLAAFPQPWTDRKASETLPALMLPILERVIPVLLPPTPKARRDPVAKAARSLLLRHDLDLDGAPAPMVALLARLAGEVVHPRTLSLKTRLEALLAHPPAEDWVVVAREALPRLSARLPPDPQR